jgi:hypothetical protein
VATEADAIEVDAAEAGAIETDAIEADATGWLLTPFLFVERARYL